MLLFFCAQFILKIYRSSLSIIPLLFRCVSWMGNNLITPSFCALERRLYKLMKCQLIFLKCGLFVLDQCRNCVLKIQFFSTVSFRLAILNSFESDNNNDTRKHYNTHCWQGIKPRVPLLMVFFGNEC